MTNNKAWQRWAAVLIAALILIIVLLAFRRVKPAEFDGTRALKDVETMLAFGPRMPQTTSHNQTVQWIQQELTKAGWQVQIQSAEMNGHPLTNIIAKQGNGSPWIILGAHYDTRYWADHDPDPARQRDPVPGANDGASGVAVLVELARVLPRDLDKQVWLVFFDGEDQGKIPAWDWIFGSKAFVASLESKPDAAVILDMIGDKDLNIYIEKNSHPGLTASIWEIAAQKGHETQFLSEPKHAMLDDHTPFIEAGIPAVDIIDFDYPYWHTTADTLDKVSAESLQAVGETIQAWLNSPFQLAK